MDAVGFFHLFIYYEIVGQHLDFIRMSKSEALQKFLCKRFGIVDKLFHYHDCHSLNLSRYSSFSWYTNKSSKRKQTQIFAEALLQTLH